MAIYKNITTGTTTTLITKGGTRNGHINKITIPKQAYSWKNW